VKALSAILACAALIGGFVLVQQARRATAAPATKPSAREVSATITKMVAEHRSKQEITQYVFDNHGCRTCHIGGPDGKPGLNEKGKQLGNDFEGCFSMLSAMNLIAQVPDSGRSPEQRRKAARFEEFGCAMCHKISPGKMGITDVGLQLTHMHLGCVDQAIPPCCKK
jgi:cytochrome c551/c552